MKDFFQIAGQVAGIGGVSLVVFLAISRGIISKTRDVNQTQSYSLLNKLLVLASIITVLGMISWLASLAIAGETSIQLKKIETNGLRPASPDLKVDFSASCFGARAELANIGAGIVKVRNIRLLAEYEEPPFLIPPPAGAPLTKYRCEATLSASAESVSLDSREFKYGNGDIDVFVIDLNVHDKGIYTLRLAFEYQLVGATKPDWANFVSDPEVAVFCGARGLPRPRVMDPTGLDLCCDRDGLYAAAYDYITLLVERPPHDWTADDARAYAKNHYPLDQIREGYIRHMRPIWDRLLADGRFSEADVRKKESAAFPP